MARTAMEYRQRARKRRALQTKLDDLRDKQDKLRNEMAETRAQIKALRNN